VVTAVSDGGIFDPATGKVKFGPFLDGQARTLTYDVFPPPGYQGVGHFAGTASANGVACPIGGDEIWAVGGPHPADSLPQNWRLEIDEVTAYAAAWRTGGVWAVEPNPIPMPYVTRAAALWRGGEWYQIDPGVGTPPEWWVNRLPQPNDAVRPLDQAGSGGSRRILPADFAVSQTVPVEIAVRPGAGTRAFAAEEVLPPGARLVSLGDGGAWDAARSRLKWGPFFDDAPRALHYEVAVAQPQTTGSGNAQLEGTALRFEGASSFDGSLAPTAGNCEIRSGSRLTWNPHVAAGDGGSSALTLRGAPGAVYQLETSTDLAHWTALSQLTNTAGVLEIPLVAPPGAGATYYRAKRLNP
jgi:hypothetical protein